MGVGVLVPSISRALSGAAVTASLGTLTGSAGTIPEPSEDVWELVSQRLSPSTNSGNGPQAPFHYEADYCSATDEIFISWRTPSSSPPTRNGTFMFNCATQQWRQTNNHPGGVDGDGNYRALGQRENYGACYDSDRNCMWIAAGSPQGAMPVGEASKYDVATDIFTSAPNASFGIVNGRVVMAYHGGLVYSWRGEGFRYYNPATDSMTFLTAPSGLSMHISGGPGNTDQRLNIQTRGGINRTGNYLWIVDLAQDFWKCDLSSTPLTWVKYTTTGDRPIAYNSSFGGESSGYPCGVAHALDESKNVVVSFIGGSYENGAYDDGNPVNKTWVLDLDTYVWRFGPQLSAGDTVPGEGTKYVGATGTRTCYDSLRQRVLFTFAYSDYCEVWTFKPRFKARFESFELPTSSGSTYGVNYAGFPFVTNAGSKNINIAYSPLTDRLYASGGDCGSNPGSASDIPGVWSMSMTDGSWRLDSGYNADANWPYPQPNGYQDGSLLAWMPVRNKFVFGFNPGESYNNPGDALFLYATGVWFYDPSLYPDPDAWTQDLTFSPNVGTAQEPSSGCDFGGVYDETTDMVYAFNSSASLVLRWDMATMTRPANVSITVNAGGLGKSFNRSGPVIVGRDIYQMGVFTDGASIRQGKMLRYNIDSGTVMAVYDTPTGVTVPSTSGIKLETSNSKVVWVNRDLATGAVSGIYVFDPTTQAWAEDTLRPAYGTFACNSSCSLPDGRVVMAGGGNGILPTHIWFYTAP